MTDVVVALDVGGTGIKCALVDRDGAVRHAERHATGRERGADAVVATILDVAEGLAAKAAAVARRYAARGGNAAGADRVAALAAAGDPDAATVWRDAVDALADGLLVGLALFDPEVVVVGGGLAEAGDALLGPLRDALNARRTFHREPELCRAALGDEAGCLGAALLALDALP